MSLLFVNLYASTFFACSTFVIVSTKLLVDESRRKKLKGHEMLHISIYVTIKQKVTKMNEVALPTEKFSVETCRNLISFEGTKAGNAII